jgi:hypothetical protein
LTGEFVVANSMLVATQAGLVAMPGAGIPAPLARLGGRAWSLLMPFSIAVVVAAIALGGDPPAARHARAGQHEACPGSVRRPGS